MRSTSTSLLVACLALGACAEIGPAEPTAGIDGGGDDGTGGDGTDDGPGGPDGGAEGSAGADAAPAAGCVEGTFQLLANPGFDDGPGVGWIEQDAPIIFPDAQIPVDTHAGGRAAWLGRAGVADQHLSQEITLPVGTTSIAFGAYVCLVTSEADSAGPIDRTTVALIDAGGATVAFRTFSNLDAGSICNWGAVSVSRGQDYAAGAATFDLHAISAAGGQTSFYFDSLSLEATTDCP